LPQPASDSTPAAAKPTIVTLTWSALPKVTWQAQDIEVPWVMALDDLWGTKGYLRLRATGLWTPLAGLPDCGPDGLAGQPFPEDRTILPDCPVGALIGRIGGSSATLKAAAPATDAGESKPFAIGSYAVLKLPDKVVGPLFVGFNIVLRPIRLRQQLVIEVEGGVST
jgi:hypothetical protein